MAERKKIRDLLGESAIGQNVEICGWVRSARKSGAGLCFVMVHDGTAFDGLQAVVKEGAPGFEVASKLSAGAAVMVTGNVIASQGKGQATEIEVTGIELVGDVEDPSTYPMQPKRHSMTHLREHAHLRPRTNLVGAVARTRHSISQAIHRQLSDDDFFWVHTPIISTHDAEGAGEMFRVSTLDMVNPPKKDGAVDFSEDFFGQEAFLTVSGQLNVEPYAMALSRVYTFGPTFRAENSNTRRHLAEFWMVEPEIAFADLSDNIDLAESFLKGVTRRVLEERADDIAFFNKFVDKGLIARLNKMLDTPFVRMDYTDAVEKLIASGKKFEVKPEWGIDLGAEHEKYLTDEVVDGPVVLMNYPRDIKAFYMRQNDDGKTVAAMDVLVPGIGEIIGGSQREERFDLLVKRMEEMKLPREHYEWYLDLRRYGTAPHAGFGLGLERLVQYLTGVENIRDVIPYPRAVGSADF